MAVLLVEFRSPGTCKLVDKSTMDPDGQWFRATRVGQINELMSDASFFQFLISASGAILERASDGLRISPAAVGQGLSGGGGSPIKLDLVSLQPMTSPPAAEDCVPIIDVSAGNTVGKTTVQNLLNSVVTVVNLAAGPSATEITISNSAGDDAVIQAATATLAGLLLPGEKSTIQSIQGVTGPVLLGRLSASGNPDQLGRGSFPLQLPASDTVLVGFQANNALAGIQFANIAAQLNKGQHTATYLTITNSVGSGVQLDVATESLAGLMSATDKEKLNDLVLGTFDLTITPGASSITFGLSGANDTLAAVAAATAGVVPSLGSLVQRAYTPGHLEWLVGFDQNTGGTTLVAYPLLDYVTIPGHGRTAADIGKPLVLGAILDDTSQTQYPTGIMLAYKSVSEIAYARPGQVISNLPVSLLDGGNTYSIASSGRFVFWDFAGAAGGAQKYVAAKPADSAGFLPDLLEVLSVGSTTFVARVRDFGPMGNVSGTSGGTPGSAEIEIVTAATAAELTAVAPAAGEKLGIDAALSELYTPVGGAWTKFPVVRGWGMTNDGNRSGAYTMNFQSGFLNRRITLTGNVTLSLTPPTQPCMVGILVTQDGTGGRGITWPATVRLPQRIILNKGVSQSTFVLLLWDGTTWHPPENPKVGVTGLGILDTPTTINFDQPIFNTPLTDHVSFMLDEDTTITLSCGRASSLRLLIAQDVTGGHTITWSNVTGTPPTLASGSLAITLVKVFSAGDGTFYFE